MLTFWIRVLWSNAILLKREVIGFNLLQENATNSKLAIAQITWVEVLSAMSRRQREGSLSESDFDSICRDFREDFDLEYRVIEVDQALFERAGQLVIRYPLRAYDAVQLASALRC